jgi:hypothetical protein
MKRLPIALLLCALFFLAMPAPARAEAEAAAITIVPELELLAGVLAQSHWPQEVGPSGQGNEYYQALQGYLAPYQEHEAVTLYNEMMSGGFSYDAPPAFMLHLGPLPHLDQVYPYNDDLIARAGGEERLERFRLALVDLAATSHFADFLEQWQPRYAQWIESVGRFDAAKVINWHETFFHEPRQRQFHMILAPGLYPGGGYGPTVVRPDGQRLVYYIVRSTQKGTGAAPKSRVTLPNEPGRPPGSVISIHLNHSQGGGIPRPQVELKMYRPLRGGLLSDGNASQTPAPVCTDPRGPDESHRIRHPSPRRPGALRARTYLTVRRQPHDSPPCA